MRRPAFSLPGLIALALLPLSAYAQQERQDSAAPQKEIISDRSGPETTAATASPDRALESNHARDLSLWTGQTAKGAQQKPKGPRPRSTEIERPPIEDSMVGYIDNAIVGSQIRVRFDAGFRDEFPDRAEFFYAKCGCFRSLPPTNPAFDPNAPGPGPGIPNSIDFQQLYFNVEYAPVRRFSVFAEVPVRWIQPQGFLPGTVSSTAPGFGSQGGLSDVEFGFKFALLASSRRYLTFQFRTYAPSGDSFKGLGTNHYSIEPSVLYFQKLTDRAALEAQVGGWHPIGGSAGVPVSSSQGFAGDIFMYGIGPSYQLYRSERMTITPVIEMFGWSVRSGFRTGAEASDTDIVNLKAGVRIGIGRRNSLYVGFGQAMTESFWYRHIVRAEYRFAF